MKKLVLCGVTAGMTAAMVMMTGCSSKDQKLAPPPGQAGLLGNREIVPPPFDSPADLKHLQRPGTAPRMDSQRILNVSVPEPSLTMMTPGNTTLTSVPGGTQQPGAYPQTMQTSDGMSPEAEIVTSTGKLQSVMPVTDLNTGRTSAVVPPPEVNTTENAVSPMFVDMKNNGKPQGAVDLNNPRQNPSPRPAVGGTAKTDATGKKPAAAVTPGTGKTYTVKANDTLITVARRYGITWQELAALNGLSYQSRLKIGDVLALPPHAKLVATPAAATTAKPAATTSKTTGSATATTAPTAKKILPADGIYSVADGDSLWKIAHKYGVKIEDIRTWNNLKTDSLRIGQKLRLKAPDGAAPAATNENSTKKAANASTPAATSKSDSGLDPRLHTVARGESLWTIARKYHVTTKDLEKWNNLKSSNLREGRTLIVAPPAQDGAAEDKPAAPAVDTAAPVAAPQAAQPKTAVPEHLPLKVSTNVAPSGIVNVSDNNVQKLNGLTVVSLQTAPEPAKPSTRTYTVKTDDSFESLKNAFGWTPEKLKELNPQLKDQDELKAGMEINVPIDEQ